MTASNLKKKEQLGIQPETARHRLTRLILFKLVQDLHKDHCFRCGYSINSIEEFSIDHINPWLDISVDLFWDLNNIAFSHNKCNSGARRNRVSKIKNKQEHRNNYSKAYYHKNKERIKAERKKRYHGKFV